MEAVHYRGEAPTWGPILPGIIDGAHGSYSAGVAVLQTGRAMRRRLGASGMFEHCRMSLFKEPRAQKHRASSS